MSQEQANLSPQDQQTLFDLLKKAGRQPTSGGQAPDTPDIQQQDGDQMHPMDAIDKIGEMIYPSAPAGVSKATGGQITTDSNGRQVFKTPSDSPLLRLFGVKQNVPVTEPNYFDTMQKAGLVDYLPSGLAQTENGSPYVGPKTMASVMGAKAVLPSNNNPMLAKEDAVALKIITPDQANTLYKDPSQKIGINELRLGVLASVADTRKGTLSLGQNKLEQQQINDLIKGISDSQASNSTPMGQQANKLNNVIHARQLVSQAFNPDTGEYDLSKAASQEMIMGVARAISPNGQLTDSTQEELSSPTAYGRMKALLQYWTGAPVNANPQEIVKMYRDMLDRQGTISQDLFNASAARELPKGLLLKKSNPLAYAGVLQNSFGTHDYRSMVANAEDGMVSKVPSAIPLGGRGTQPPAPDAQNSPVPTPPPPSPQPHFQSVADVKAAYQAGKLSIQQAKALFKAMQQGK